MVCEASGSLTKGATHHPTFCKPHEEKNIMGLVQTRQKCHFPLSFTFETKYICAFYIINQIKLLLVTSIGELQMPKLCKFVFQYTFIQHLWQHG